MLCVIKADLMPAISVFLEHTAMFLRRIAPNALTRKKLL
ncbi:hypothetical protein VCRA2128O106_190015 [Vibrio crassostreae]|nr:hypothetical protein VCRA2111O408_200015 [Vibrio crassostreae]CAK2677174.1 hypothetical protein VCRA2128O106_190015 [Vibrio crassostreae]CAK2677799.1 hypothetical protein VCRA2125O83_190015 [Vibrio crassostreae]CAK2744084.1 hypothetical protein VCRA2127O91_210015 [Vibrio crassostreae]CAK2753747.1 hypothetical protein VCRA2126O86_220015 [Vibrio crassostreae]